jgi:hypothetical protein
MGRKEFGYSVLASIIAAVLLDLLGIVELAKYLSITVNLPIWALILFVVLPILLSLIWFRKTITPAHEDLITKFRELEGKKAEIENTLTESRSHTSSLEVIISSIKSQMKENQEHLSDWQARGIKLWKEGDQPEQIVNKKFGPEIVEIDGKHFIGCQFEGSILKFKGIGPVNFSHDSFYDVRWVVDRPASEAISFFSGMYQSGIPELIKGVDEFLEGIKGNTSSTG